MPLLQFDKPKQKNIRFRLSLYWLSIVTGEPCPVNLALDSNIVQQK